MTEPGWVEHAIWCQIYPLGFVDAESAAPSTDGAVSHRLLQLNGWLDYAVDLGVSGLALGPVFASETHGYDTADYYRIDPRLGEEADFDDLITQAHARA
jgi:cyclomaltodextrinase